MKTYNSRSSLMLRFLLSLSLIFFLSVVFFYVKDYMRFSYLNRRKFTEKCLLVESSAVKMARMVHWGFVLQDKAIDTTVEMALKRLKETYVEKGQNPYYMDLDAISKRLSYLVARSPDEFSLSVINRDGVIIYSTDEKSIGLDFKRWPPFYEQIKKIFKGHGSSVDPWSRKLEDPSKAFKFGYIPTPDGLYLLSIGLFGKGVYEEGTEKFSFKKLLSTIAEQDIDMVYSAFINRNFRVISTIDGNFDDTMINMDLDPAFIKETLHKVQDSRENISYELKDKNLQVNFAYVDFQNTISAAGENLNMVLLSVYSTSGLKSVLREKFMGGAIAVSLVLFSFILGVLLFYRYLSFYLAAFGNEINAVVESNFERNFVHNVKFGRMEGLKVIESSVNRVLYNIKSNIGDLRKSSEALEGERFLRVKAENELLMANNILFTKVNMDELTGVYNRKQIMSCLRRELARAKEEKDDLGLIMIDIDHFKGINDVMGYLFGDRILTGLGHFLVETSDKKEIDGRYGSSEFMVLLPGASLEYAIKRAEHLRKGFFNINFDDVHVTISLGVTDLQVNDSAESFLTRADKLLSIAKEKKNKVCSGPNRDSLIEEGDDHGSV